MKKLALIAILALPNLAMTKPRPLSYWACVINGSGKMHVLEAVSADWAREMAARALTKEYAMFGGDETGNTRPIAVEQVACMALYGVDVPALKKSLGDQLF